LSPEDVAHRFGPFDLIIVGSTDSCGVTGLKRGLEENGALANLALGNDAMEICAATPRPSFTVRHQVKFRPGDDDPIHTDRARRNLALADNLYPGWVMRLLDSCETPAEVRNESAEQVGVLAL
jgi:hypothetical protein